MLLLGVCVGHKVGKSLLSQLFDSQEYTLDLFEFLFISALTFYDLPDSPGYENAFLIAYNPPNANPPPQSFIIICTSFQHKTQWLEVLRRAKLHFFEEFFYMQRTRVRNPELVITAPDAQETEEPKLLAPIAEESVEPEEPQAPKPDSRPGQE
jgi:hypothetical protein